MERSKDSAREASSLTVSLENSGPQPVKGGIDSGMKSQWEQDVKHRQELGESFRILYRRGKGLLDVGGYSLGHWDGTHLYGSVNDFSPDRMMQIVAEDIARHIENVSALEHRIPREANINYGVQESIDRSGTFENRTDTVLNLPLHVMQEQVFSGQFRFSASKADGSEKVPLRGWPEAKSTEPYEV